jgi:CRISPR-associated protein (Cas_Cas02710)
MRLTWIQDAIKDPAKNVLATIVVTTFGLGVLTNGVSALVLESLGSWIETTYRFPKVWFQALMVGMVFLLLLGGLYLTSMTDWVQWRLGNDQPSVRKANVKDLDYGFKGLVVAVSKPRAGHTEQTPAEAAIRFHCQDRDTLEHCWMICTEQSEGEAAAIVNRMEALGVKAAFHFGEQHVLWQRHGAATSSQVSLLLTDQEMDDPNVVRQLVDQIYVEAEHYGLPETDMVADYTGGTKSMTAGIMLACVNPDRQVQYFSQVSKKLMLVQTAYELKGRRSRNG